MKMAHMALNLLSLKILKGGDGMNKVEYKFYMDQCVTTPFGDNGIIEMLGYNDGGIKYYVKTKADSSWFKEAELTSSRTGLNG